MAEYLPLYEALRNNNINIFYSEGYDKKTGKITQLQTSLQAAQKADAVIVCIGELAEQSGESKSKTNIEIPEEQQQLIKELKKQESLLLLY